MMTWDTVITLMNVLLIAIGMFFFILGIEIRADDTPSKRLKSLVAILVAYTIIYPFCIYLIEGILSK